LVHLQSGIDTAYYALRDFLVPDKIFRIYLDYMDTQGSARAKTLVDVLKHHAACPIYAHIIRSHESQLIQLCDLLVGAVTYANRTDIPRHSPIKKEVIAHIEQALRRNLTYGSSPWETKFNLFKFKQRGGA